MKVFLTPRRFCRGKSSDCPQDPAFRGKCADPVLYRHDTERAAQTWDSRGQEIGRRTRCQRGAPAAKRAWTERNMIEDISAGLELWEDVARPFPT